MERCTPKPSAQDRLLSREPYSPKDSMSVSRPHPAAFVAATTRRSSTNAPRRGRGATECGDERAWREERVIKSISSRGLSSGISDIARLSCASRRAGRSPPPIPRAGSNSSRSSGRPHTIGTRTGYPCPSGSRSQPHLHKKGKQASHSVSHSCAIRVRVTRPVHASATRRCVVGVVIDSPA
jgi:hypothetical protein